MPNSFPRRLAFLLFIGCAPAVDVVVPPVTSVRVVEGPRFDYPSARRTDDADVLHGVRVADPYRWLETDSDETRTWFEAEDERARRVLARCRAEKR